MIVVTFGLERQSLSPSNQPRRAKNLRSLWKTPINNDVIDDVEPVRGGWRRDCLSAIISTGCPGEASVRRSTSFHAVVESFRFAAGGGERRLALAIRSIAAERVGGGRPCVSGRRYRSRFGRWRCASALDWNGRVSTRRSASCQKDGCNEQYFFHASSSFHDVRAAVSIVNGFA